ncbi:DNA polymerase III subunit gamma and tau [Umezawaea sp. Da 62-37]|uniref:DNA polymerase III subunit gamma and tau n=1 Tax=Umezawaea sp. Da 62-37 TaxID=3075927 RepID=UPI0028F6F8D0|nr:DNA polymerase III subunit gamma and tau [Umezawaea sp. Da 62-37]WNV91643.1 DNA polymerase III subunit gamma and tau [Umezawaea sp. Da 62-37]
MALALYRKYRPATFAEVVGQEHVTDPLRIALGTGRINHAYLFSGPRGCGKTSSARILARSLNCAKGPTPDPCGECNSCVGLAPNGSGTVDVVELDAASHGGVDDARELRDKAFYAPAEAKYRVFIVDEAHMVTTQGFNALLKIVEEPPEHLIFIFATTEPDKVLPTIRSRTHHYPFRLIPPGSMRALLERNCAAEGVTVAPAVFPLVIRAGGGSARDTQSVLDQLLSGAGPEGVTYEGATALLGVTDVALIDDAVDGLGDGDGAAVFGTIDRLVEAGHDPRRFASDLLERLRDLVLLCAVPDAADRGLVSAPEDELVRMVAQARRIGPATLTRFAEIVHTGLVDMRGATAARLVLELVCARMLLPAASSTEAAVLQRVEQLEKRGPAPAAAVAPAAQAAAPVVQAVAAAAPAQAPVAAPPAPVNGKPAFQRPSQRAAEPEPAPEEPVAARPAVVPPSRPAVEAPSPEPVEPEPEPEPVAAGGGLDVAAVRRRWAELVTAVRAVNTVTAAMLANAMVTDVDGTSVVISHPSAPVAGRLTDARAVGALTQAFGTVLSGSWQVTVVHGDPAAGGPVRPEKTKAAKPAPTRPSQAGKAAAVQPPQRQSSGRPPADDVPPPPEPPDLDEPPLPPEPVDEEEMLAEASLPTDPDAPRQDPEAAVLQLLADELGARPLKTERAKR